LVLVLREGIVAIEVHRIGLEMCSRQNVTGGRTRQSQSCQPAVIHMSKLSISQVQKCQHAKDNRTKQSESSADDYRSPFKILGDKEYGAVGMLKSARLKTARDSTFYPPTFGARLGISSFEICMTCDLISEVTQHKRQTSI
jgi:hypothetical protein